MKSPRAILICFSTFLSLSSSLYCWCPSPCLRSTLHRSSASPSPPYHRRLISSLHFESTLVQYTSSSPLVYTLLSSSSTCSHFNSASRTLSPTHNCYHSRTEVDHQVETFLAFLVHISFSQADLRSALLCVFLLSASLAYDHLNCA